MSARIKEIANAATLLFLKQGYAKTQISHIAKAVGVSVGTIYLDFAGKREIADYILQCTISPEFAQQELETPIRNEQFFSLEVEISRAFEVSTKDFEKPLRSKNSDYNFANLISDAFDILSKYAVGCLFIEKNQFDFKFLAESYTQYREKFFSIMTAYLRTFMHNGIIREMDNLELEAVFIVEALSWWAMDMRYISFEISDIPLETAKKVCMDNLIAAYKK